MANTLKVKRSATPSKVPTTSDLELGEIAVNTYDGVMYIKKDNGTASIVQVGGGSGSGDVVGPSSATDNAVARFDTTTGKLIQNSVVTVSDTGDIAGAQSISNLDYAQFDTTATPTIALGKQRWNTATNTLAFGIIDGTTEVNIGEQLYAYVTNAEAVTITAGQAVYLYQATGNRASVKLAYNTGDASSSKTLGLVTQDIAAGATGFVTTQGVLEKLNTSAFAEGDTLYLGATPGSLTATKPSAPNHLVYIGVVERANAGNGQIYVKPQNGYELEELHNVAITSPANGQTIVYDASTSLWKNANITAGTGISVTNGAGSITIANTGVTSVAMTVPTGLSISGTPITTSGTLALTLTSGYSIPTTASQTNWDSAYTQRLQWDGGSTNLVAATGRTSLGGTTVGQNFFTLTNPTAITFPRINADNTVSALDAATFRSAIGAGTGSGTVTSVGGTGTVNGLTLSGTVTSSGNLTLSGAISGVPNSATTATNLNTASAIVARDASGNFSAGTITATLSGNATSATTATTANALNTANSYTGVNLTATGTVYSSATGGFASSTYAAGVRNPIWRFGNADGYGLSYFQGTAGIGGADTIGFHFGTATAAGSQFQFISNGNLNITGAYTGAGTGLTGTASSLSIGGNAATATLATKASTLSQNGGNGAAMTFNWSGQSGQPSWLWGSNDGTNIYVYNPSNFSVSSASTATNASYAYNYTQGFNSNWNTDFQSTPAGSQKFAGDTSTGSSTGGPGGTWWFQQNFRHTNASNYWGVQVAWGWEDNANLLRTRNVTGGSYGSWVTYINSNNIGSQTVANTTSISSAVGGTYTWTGTQYFQNNAVNNTGTGTSATLQAYSNTGSGGAYMAFHRPGVYAVNMGLDSDNVFRIGGWSASANRLQMDMSGNLTMAGNVAASSDERLKKNWRPVQNNFVAKLATIKSGIYDRTDEELTQAGVSAQSLQTLLPETVNADNDGMLNVSYGNAALVAAIELAKVVEELRAEIAQLKSQIKA